MFAPSSDLLIGVRSAPTECSKSTRTISGKRMALMSSDWRASSSDMGKDSGIDDFAGDAHDGHAGRQDILDDHGAGPDADVVRDADAAEDLGVLPDVDVVADDGGVVGIAAVAADAAVAVDDAALADAGFRIDDDGTVVLQLQVFAEAAGADDKSEAGAEAVFAPAVPEAEQFVRAGEGVLLLGPEESQIAFDVIHLRPDPPLEEDFFQCHKKTNYSFLNLVRKFDTMLHATLQT